MKRALMSQIMIAECFFNKISTGVNTIGSNMFACLGSNLPFGSTSMFAIPA